MRSLLSFALPAASLLVLCATKISVAKQPDLHASSHHGYHHNHSLVTGSSQTRQPPIRSTPGRTAVRAPDALSLNPSHGDRRHSRSNPIVADPAGGFVFVVSDKPETDDSETAMDAETPDKSDASSPPNAEAESSASNERRRAAPSARRSSTGAARSGRSAAESALIERGRMAFEQSCTQCHDAERALEKRKSRAGWLKTVRRMSRMEDAEIDAADIGPIVAYLTSRSLPSAPPETAARAGDESADDADDTLRDLAEGLDLDDEEILGTGVSFSGTISTLWRGGNDNLENSDFFPDVWLRADWQPAGPIRGRVTTCTSCHSDQTGGGGFTVELVEAVAYLDILQALTKSDRRHSSSKKESCGRAEEYEASLKAGRFVVPFGAYSARIHPGIYRTVTNPLMFNMGRNVNVIFSRPPVLPMPYADEGIDLYLKIPVGRRKMTATFDFYAVNGLQGFGPGVQFTPSRSYTDNNSEPSLGARATIGSRSLRLGGSVMGGQLQADMLPKLDYHLAGADVTARYRDTLRFYYEYAIRNNDANLPRGQIAYGNVFETEVLLCESPKASLLLRYDNLQHRRQDTSSVHRFTWGLGFVLPGGSPLYVNHERWNFSGPDPDVDVLGLRWVTTF